MMWEYCRFCNLTGYCENQNMCRECNSGVKKLYEENEALKKQLKIAVDCLKKYANEDLWSDYEEGDVIYFDCIFKSLGYDFAQKALKKIERN